MQANFLLINDSHEHYWLQVLQKALCPLGALQIGTTNTILAGLLREHYDSIIVDATVVEDAPDILSCILEQQPDAQIVVVTASPTWTRARAAFQAGAVDYIRKSMNPDELRVAFERILARPSLLPLQSKEQSTMIKATMVQRDVFIVHGHDDAAKEAVARFIEKLGLHAIILREQPDSSRTIIEKFEHHSNVGFAIVLLTPDDVGAAKDAADHLMARARQNVIFELGYFIGKLGRSRVCALYKEGVEIPYDYHSVMYLSMDAAESWKLALARIIKNAGIDIDLNKAI